MAQYMDRLDGESKSCFPIVNCGAVTGGETFLLREGKANILIDTGYGFCGEQAAENIKNQLGDNKLDCILITHSHYDHAMGLPFIKELYPNAKVISSVHCKEILLKESARKAIRNMDITAAKAYGYPEPRDLTDKLSIDMTVNDGDVFTIGNAEIVATALPGHTNCCMGYYFKDKKFLVSCESIGIYVGGLDATPGCLVGYKTSLDSIDKVMNMDIDEMLVSHNGILYGKYINEFLSNSKEALEDGKRIITAALKNGKTESEIIEIAKGRYYSDEIGKFYPMHAFVTNTKAQIKMFSKEFNIPLKE